MTKINLLLSLKYKQSVEEEISCEKKFGGKLFLLSFIKELLSSYFLMQFFLMAYLLYQVLVARTLRGSDFIAAYNAANVIMSGMMMIVKCWGQMASSRYTVDKCQKFLLSAPREEICGRNGQKDSEESEHRKQNGWDRGCDRINSIEFRKVSFSYPGTEKYVLKNISFCVRSGEKIAIVGKNGSGKTTLVHLLMGLYYPTEGEILINGKLLDRKKTMFYRQEFAAFFQGMRPLEATVAENIALDTEIDEERISLALHKTGCDTLFSQSERAMIGIQFDPAGCILSGGEYQKLMLAHCFYCNKSILVMDEPSSALDPVMEQAFNRQIAELSGDKLSIFVTHRLSTVHMADMIYVIEGGRLCDRGSHEELVRKGGIYADMWKIQLEKYGSV